LISSFGERIQTGFAAVRVALTELWSNGQTEGQVTELKLVKPKRYDRAKPTRTVTAPAIGCNAAEALIPGNR
jgi:transposase